MKPIAEFIVVEFDIDARFLRKLTIKEFNDKQIKAFAEGKINPRMIVVAVYESESEADDYIKLNKDNIDKFCMVINQYNEIIFA